MRKRFDVDIEYPEMVYWRLASGYLLKGKLAGMMTLLDNLFYRHKLFLRWSYRQYVKISVRGLAETDAKREPQWPSESS